MSKRSCPDPTCGIAQSLSVLGEKWALLIVRDAFYGRTRFSEFKASLGVSPDVLTARLGALVDAGVLTRQCYREPGEREREEYLLTDAGRELSPVLAALGAWGVDHRPADVIGGGSYTEAETGERLKVAFVTGDGRIVPTADVRVGRTSRTAEPAVAPA
ncbi:winged helix-turn-helix transcriptional regulator [Frondihabitans australicus]|nr:helix-turn-helix domain-containing protein [Frondihabitans australicus]